jgi:hypothetical protein
MSALRTDLSLKKNAKKYFHLIDYRWKMVSSGMLSRVALVRTGDWEELSDPIIRVTRIGELGTTLAVTSSYCHTA